MADIIPSGIDATTGQNRTLTSSDTLADSSGSPVSSAALPTRFIEGLQVEYAGTSSISVRPGSCRNIADAADITLSTKTTADVDTKHSASTGLAQINGIDEKGLDNLVSGAITCSQSGTTITATGDVTPHYGTRSITGTISATGTALTGSGTLFTEELSHGDLVGSSTTYGWSQIASIESDTAATLTLAFPGGNPTSIAATVIHNAWIQPAAGVTERVRTINAAGTSIVVWQSTPYDPLSALTIGGAAPDFYGYWQWLAVWLIDDGSTPALLLSTQHENLLAPPAGYTSARRVGWALYGDFEGDVAFMADPYYVDAGHYRFVRWGTKAYDLLGTTNDAYENEWREFPMGSNGTSGGPTCMPRTSTRAQFLWTQLTTNTEAGSYYGYSRARGETGSTPWPITLINDDAWTDNQSAFVELQTDKAQVLELRITAPASGQSSIILTPMGFWDTL
jgi:hypothetical protein